MNRRTTVIYDACGKVEEHETRFPPPLTSSAIVVTAIQLAKFCLIDERRGWAHKSVKRPGIKILTSHVDLCMNHTVEVGHPAIEIHVISNISL